MQAAKDIPRILEIHIDLASNKITDKSLDHIGKLSPLTTLSAISGNFIENFQAVENLRQGGFYNAMRQCCISTSLGVLYPRHFLGVLFT